MENQNGGGMDLLVDGGTLLFVFLHILGLALLLLNCVAHLISKELTQKLQIISEMLIYWLLITFP